MQNLNVESTINCAYSSELYCRSLQEEISNAFILMCDVKYESLEEEKRIKQKYERVEVSVKKLMQEIDDQLLIPTISNKPKSNGQVTVAAKPGFMAKRNLEIKTPSKLLIKNAQQKNGNIKEGINIGNSGNSSKQFQSQVQKNNNQVVLAAENTSENSQLTKNIHQENENQIKNKFLKLKKSGI